MNKGLYKITKEKDIDRLLDSGRIGKGTAHTGKTALKQGKPLFVVFPRHITPEKASKMILKMFEK